MARSSRRNSPGIKCTYVEPGKLINFDIQNLKLNPKTISELIKDLF
jgi:hypothetical protein